MKHTAPLVNTLRAEISDQIGPLLHRRYGVRDLVNERKDAEIAQYQDRSVGNHEDQGVNGGASDPTVIHLSSLRYTGTGQRTPVRPL